MKGINQIFINALFGLCSPLSSTIFHYLFTNIVSSLEESVTGENRVKTILNDHIFLHYEKSAGSSDE